MSDYSYDLARQIKAVKRELGLRRSVYPKRVAEGRMTQAMADDENQAMQAVLKTLEDLQTGNHQQPDLI